MSRTKPLSKRIRTDTKPPVDTRDEFIRFYRPWWFNDKTIVQCDGFMAWEIKSSCVLPTTIVGGHYAAVTMPPPSVSIKGTRLEQMMESAMACKPGEPYYEILRNDMRVYQQRDATAQEIEMAHEVARYCVAICSGCRDENPAFAAKVAGMTRDERRMLYEFGYIAQQIGDGIISAIGSWVDVYEGDILRRLSEVCKSQGERHVSENVYEFVNSVEHATGCSIEAMASAIYKHVSPPIQPHDNTVADIATHVQNIARMYYARHPDMDAVSRNFIHAFNAMIQCGTEFPHFQVCSCAQYHPRTPAYTHTPHTQINEIPSDFLQNKFMRAAEAYQTARHTVEKNIAQFIKE